MPKCIELLPCDRLISNFIVLPSNLTGVPNKVAGECIHVHQKTNEYHGKGLYFFCNLIKKNVLIF